VLRVGDREYMGHPDLACNWTRNVEAAGGGELEEHDRRRRRFRATLLKPGPERDAVIRATFTQHPFPGGAVYWLFRGSIRSTGRFYRLSFDLIDPRNGSVVGPDPARPTPARARSGRLASTRATIRALVRALPTEPVAVGAAPPRGQSPGGSGRDDDGGAGSP
jgi:hypothetical protein